MKKNKALKITFITFVVLFVIIIALQYFASNHLVKLINKELPKSFPNGASVGKISLNLVNGSLAVHNILINQPEGFKGKKLLQLKKIVVNVQYLALLKKKIVVDKFGISGLNLNIVKNKSHEINAIKLADSFSKNTKVTKKSSSEKESTEIIIKKVFLHDIFINYDESGNSEQKIRAEVSDIDLDINKIIVNEQITIANIAFKLAGISAIATGLEQGDIDVALDGLNLQINDITQAENKVEIRSIDLNLMKLKANMQDVKKGTTNSEISDLSLNISDLLQNKDKITIGKISKEIESLFFENLDKNDKILSVNLGKFQIDISDIFQEKNNFQVKDIASHKFNIDFEMQEKEKNSLQINLTEMQLKLSDLTSIKEDKSVAKLNLTGKILDEKNIDHLLGIYARFGAIKDDIPPTNAYLQIIGFELEKFGSLIPIGTSQSLGGDAFDLNTEITVSPNILDCVISLSMNQGSKIGMKIGGTPDKPELDTSSLLFGVLGRFGGGIGGTVAKLGGTSFKVAKTGVNTALGIGKGTGNVIGSIGKGVFKTVKGVATADISEIGEGLKTTTVGTVTEAGKTVLKTGENLLEGTGEALSEVSGITKARKWRTEKQKRWDKTWEKAKEEINKKTLPIN
ncbi:MAG: hypothetical protein K8S23_16930 [Candidatus Cloacimonetes bacterium]|nr:hypothetical protein [Candidatus Cloacimonadota bacterium]